MEKLIKSTELLQADINKCVNDLVDARIRQNRHKEQIALEYMEILMVGSLQQLQYILDVLVPLSRARKSEEGCLVLSKESRDALLAEMESMKRGPCVKVEQPLQEKIEEMLEYFRNIDSKQVDLGKDERGLMYGMLTYKEEETNEKECHKEKRTSTD